jgi:formiminoglutamate deiminase
VPREATRYFAGYAALPDGIHPAVHIAVRDGRFTEIAPDCQPQPGDELLPGLVLPGLANTHSHAFHRALRGRTHNAEGTFWTWREAMYRVANRLDPDRYFALARATYAEMALAGVSSVGEFHYLHRQPDGRPYRDANQMSHALRHAAREAGVRLTLLDCAYLAGGIDRPVGESQRRFSDGSVSGWATRHAVLDEDDATRVGVAIHSIRAVPRDAVPILVDQAHHRPLHFHLSEQPAENESSLAAYGRTPTAVFFDAGALGPHSTAVHATHLTDQDIFVLGRSGTSISLCPTTERDLADGIGPARQLCNSGAPLTLGTDQHAVIDLFEEARAVEMDERLVTGRRGRFRPSELVDALTAAGQHSLGWSDAGRIEPGARADLVEVRLDTPRTAGCLVDQVILAATAADIRTVVVDGRAVVCEGQHVLGDLGALLNAAIEPIWRAA